MPYNDKNTDSDLRLMVRYPDQPQATGYAAEELGALDLAYASTIHKSQGSEYPVVVLMILHELYELSLIRNYDR